MADNRPIVIVVDDDRFHLGNIKLELEEHARVYAFHPKELLDLGEHEDIIKAADYALIDYDLKRYTSIDIKVAEYLKTLGFKGKMLLCSLHDKFFGDDNTIALQYDRIISKENLTWAGIIDPPIRTPIHENAP